MNRCNLPSDPPICPIHSQKIAYLASISLIERLMTMAKIQQREGNGGPVQFRHRMEGLTSFVDGHRHSFGNLTDLFIPEDGRHSHTFQGITTTAEMHRHSYSGRTGLNIGTGRNHFHRFRIQTNIADGHRHIISGRTTGLIRLGSRIGHRLIIESIVRKRVK